MKKRFLTLFLLLAMLFSLASCAGGDGFATTTTTGSDVDGLFTDYLPEDSEDEVISSSTTTEVAPTVQPSVVPTTTTPVTQEPPVTDIPVVSTDSVTSSSTSTTSTFKKTWSYSTSTDNSGNNGSSLVPDKWEPLNVVANQVLALDQKGGRVVLYDIAKATNKNLDKAELWSFKCGYAAGVKYREGNARFGNVIIIAGTKSQIVTYPGKVVKWSTKNSGNNPHSIEILPSGNVVIASSTGSTLRLFDTTKSNSYKEYELKGAHGVLWDPTYKLLWAVGDYRLVSYKVTGSGSSEALVKEKEYVLPREYGHDLSADFLSKDHLYLTVGSLVYRFHKPSGTFLSAFLGSSAMVTYPRVSETETKETKMENVKGFGVNPNGNFFYCFPNFGKGRDWSTDDISEWCTDSIHFVRQTGARKFELEVYTSPSSAYYKCRVFYGKYQ